MFRRKANNTPLLNLKSSADDIKLSYHYVSDLVLTCLFEFALDPKNEIDPNKFTHLLLDRNKLTRFVNPVFTNIRELYLNDNNITEFNVTRPTLTHLYLTNNKLTSLDTLHFKHLERLCVENNLLTRLQVNDEIKYLNSSFNKVETLDLSKCQDLTDLFVNNNQLSELVVSKKLIDLHAKNNLIEKIDISGDSLIVVYLRNNKLSDVKISN